MEFGVVTSFKSGSCICHFWSQSPGHPQMIIGITTVVSMEFIEELTRGDDLLERSIHVTRTSVRFDGMLPDVT